MVIDITDFFLQLKNEVYCVIKFDKRLPDYLKGSDIDIFCYNSDSLVKIILEVGNKYIDEGFEILVSNKDAQIHVDFLKKETQEIELRFDIYNELPVYHNVLLKPALFESILENRISFELISGCNIFIPSPIDDNIIRYIEYQEWYGKRPDKIKHINYILDSCNTADINMFLQKLHHYTQLPQVHSVFPKKTNKFNSINKHVRNLLFKGLKRLKLLIFRLF